MKLMMQDWFSVNDGMFRSHEATERCAMPSPYFVKIGGPYEKELQEVPPEVAAAIKAAEDSRIEAQKAAAQAADRSFAELQKLAAQLGEEEESVPPASIFIHIR